MGAETAKFDLTLSMSEDAEGLRGSLQYSTDLFDDATIARMIEHFQTLLEGVVTNAGQRISDLPILSEIEKHQLLVEWNYTQRDYSQDKCIHQLFEEQVEKTPDAVAVVYEDEQLTYRELNQQANRLAHYLRRLDVRPEALIGICMERSLEMVVGLLGILKAGGAYVPLDPSYPKERLAFMLEDAQAAMLLTQQRLVEKLPNSTVRFVCLDTRREEIARESDQNPTSGITSDNLAYLIYTSGSTGQPKGVAIEHRSSVALLSWAHSVFRAEDMAGVLASTSICFDLFVFELFAPLSRGGQVILADNALCLPAIPAASQVTLINTVPSAIAELLGTGGIPTSVHCINLAGELLTSSLVKDIYERTSVREVYDLYGPSEDTTYSTFALRSPTGRQMIGKPISNTQVYILDCHLNQAPIGVPGELCIGGGGLARGYLNHSELTAERFVANPFSDEPGARLYKTGDLARYLPDGNIEFFGRNDHQVKIRGFRIELGEIESALSQHPLLREAILLAREDDPADKRLVAYVVPGQQPAPTSNELRSFLKQKLPEYMVPSTFVFLETLPLTPNGKLDRKALPAPDPIRAALSQTFVGPRSPVEQIIAQIWADVLKVEKVGIHDNFFDLGGHSLLATQAMSRICQALRVELPLRALFERPTVAELAKSIDQVYREEQRLAVRPIVPFSRDKDLSLSFSQQRLWFLDQYEPNSSVYNVPSAMRLKGELNRGALEQSLQEIVRRHESLRTTFSMIEGEPVQVISTSLNSCFSVVDLSDVPESERQEEAGRLSRQEAERPFDLARGPLFRTTLLRLGEQDHVLLLTMHHVVSDGWSMGVLHRELSELYRAFISAQPSRLPELPIQYADYAVWQRQWLQGEVLDRQLSYWRKQLEGIPAVLNLPTDRPRPAVQSFRGKRQTVELSKELTEGLKALSRKQGVTLFMTLLAAFQTLLYRYTGQEDIVVGSPIANRNRTEIEGLIGFFVNTLVLRTDLSGNPTFCDLLARVREVTLGAYAHQDVPFEKLLEELRPERDLSRSPLFQVFFNMVNVGESRLELFGVKTERLSTGSTGSKFDLTIYAREERGRIHLNFVYNADLFKAPRMIEMAQQYEKLLTQIVEDPDENIASFSLLTPRAKKVLPDPTQVLCSDWVGAVHERFSQQAQTLPEQIAVSDPQSSWTYGELNARSNQLAHRLLASGIQRGDIVAIYGHRSAALAWALLGILKAGAAFLILDPAYPAARLLTYIKDAKPRGWIQLEAADAPPDELAEFIDRTVRCRIILPRQKTLPAEGFLEKYSSLNPVISICPDDIACISYTSGSTGEPKGILGRHGPLSHFLPWQANKFSLTSSDRFSLLSGLSHDPLQREIFTSLWIGATICVPDPDIIGNPGELARWMNQREITFAHLTPALGRLLTETANPDCQLTSLRHAFLVGDKLTEADVNCLRRLAPGVTCVNYYGSTETQRAVSYYEISPDSSVLPQQPVIPIGRGMPDVQLLILNNRKALAGIGEVGEIYMRSPHLAKGYLGDESLTTARFVVNPFSQDDSDRLYKSGDLGRYRPDGNAEILGRIDGQVKIRGFRLEPAEIESVLGQYSEVREAVVTLRENASGDQWLAGYVVLQHGSAASKQDLRSFLSKKLPRYMVPSEFLFLSSLPLTPNGKVDYRALPEPNHAHIGGYQYVEPRDEIECRLCRVWSEVLGIDRIGVDDDFFAIGGHSLLASKLFARLDEEFGRSLPVGILFAAPTVRSLAEHYRVPKITSQTPALVAITAAGILPPVYAVPGVYGSVLAYTNLSQALGSNQPFYGLQSLGLDGAEPPLENIEKMAKRYISEILLVQPRGPYAIIGACFGATVAYEMTRQLLDEGKEVAFLGLLDPTHREGYEATENTVSVPRIINRAKVLGTFLRGRLRLYFNELKALGTTSRIKFVTNKLGSLSSKIGNRNGYRGVRREFHQLEVVWANIRALDRYRRQSLNGRLKAVEIFETSHPRNTSGWNFEWKTMWDGQPLRHRLPGKDSGDMVSSENVRVLAPLLAERLREAFGDSSDPRCEVLDG
ncbi:MAG TPA: amino acid adenylation domain-containing protein [Candidatus Binatia bacterium]|nr:amino acid adenylation domain-containing protein [Candidatus Binatia bacterium]